MRITTLVLSVFTTTALLAEHLPGGSITYQCTGNNTYEVTLQLWRECSGSPMLGQSLTFSSDCGVLFTLNNVPLIDQQEVSPICPDQQDETTCNGGTLIGIEQYTYRTTLFLSPCNGWTLAWNTCCRNESVNLISTQGIYIEAQLNNVGGACLVSPTFSDDQPPYVCVDQPVSYDPGVISQPGQVLRYRLIDARRQTGTNPIVVDPVFYEAPYTGEEPFTGMVIDSLTGNISFLPTLQGYVVCAVEVSVYNDLGNWVGSVMRDFPFVVQACTNNVPDATSGITGNATGGAATTGDYEVTACSDGSFCVDFTIADADAVQALSLTSNVDLVLSGATFNVVGTNPAVATVCWNTSGADPGSYNFTITATDDACPTPGSQTYTYTLTVVQGGFGAGDDASAEICQGATVDLSELVTGVAGGTWSDGPIVGAAGEYAYTVASPCGDDEAIFTVTVNSLPSAGADASTTICSGTSVDLSTLVTGDPGGTWSSGDPVVSAEGMYMYTVTNNCGSDMAHFVVSVVQAPDAGVDSSISICSDATPFSLFALLGGTPQAGGTWLSGTMPHNGSYDPDVDGPGVFCYTVEGTPPCANAVACITVTENTVPDAGLDNAIAYCPNAMPFNMLDSLLGTPGTGGSWTAPDAQAHSNVYAPAGDIPGIYCYTIPGIAPCADGTACLTITELPSSDPYCIWLGALDPQGTSLVLAPNPSNGRLRVEGLRSACARADVLDVQGRTVWGAKPNATGSFSVELPLSMASGSYLLRLGCTDGSVITQRFELQR